MDGVVSDRAGRARGGMTMAAEPSDELRPARSGSGSTEDRPAPLDRDQPPRTVSGRRGPWDRP
ncbi:MAG TPA: hypothetical protein VFR53_01355, partial [Methylomirabilota bacterium]|nr:hypothetical protein [Methylomirabilota bacterium]